MSLCSMISNSLQFTPNGEATKPNPPVRKELDVSIICMLDQDPRLTLSRSGLNSQEYPLELNPDLSLQY